MSKSYNTYISVSITKYTRHPDLNTGYFYISVVGCKLVSAHDMSFKDGKRELAKLALKMGKMPEKEPNQYDPSIITYKLSGFLD